MTRRTDSALVVVKRSVVALRQDRLYRTSVLLIGDNLLLGMFGGLFIVIADISGKGVSAAILASTLQGTAFDWSCVRHLRRDGTH